MIDHNLCMINNFVNWKIIDCHQFICQLDTHWRSKQVRRFQHFLVMKHRNYNQNYSIFLQHKQTTISLLWKVSRKARKVFRNPHYRGKNTFANRRRKKALVIWYFNNERNIKNSSKTWPFPENHSSFRSF